MKPQSPTIDNLFAGLRRLHPGERKTRLVNWALTVWGLLRARSAMIPDIAAQLPLPIQANSREKRLCRWLDNPAVEVAGFFAPVARCVLKCLAEAGAPLRLLIDRVEVENRQNLLIVCVAYRQRAFPLLWHQLGHRGASTQQEQIALLAEIRKWIPQSASVYVIGDREFRGVTLAAWLQKQHWYFVLRVKGNTRVCVKGGLWPQLQQLGLRRGQRIWLMGVHLALRNPFGPVNVLLYWGRTYNEPWYLLTNVAGPEETIKLFRTRMWCEELWRDFKRQGFDLEASLIVTGARLERLLLAVALAAIWALWTGVEMVRRHQRRLIDNRRHRRLSFFLIGIRWFEHCLALNQPLTFLLPPDPLEVTL